jgi:hypothetical protein
MGTRKLLIAAVVLAALSGVLWWSNKHPDWGQDKKPDTETPVLMNVSDSAISSIDIQKRDGPKVTVERKNGRWAITSPTAYPADQDAMSSIVSALSPANADSTVDDKPADVAKYGLTNPTVTVDVHEKSGRTDQLLIGDDVPAGSSMVYVRVAGNPKVYAAASSVKTTFDKALNDLRDKRLLTFDQGQLTRVDLAVGKINIEFGKNNQSEWTIVQPQPYRADNFQVEELLRKLSDAKMDLNAAAADSEKAQKGFASGKPVAEVKLTDSTGTQTLDVRKNGDDYFGKSSAVNGFYKLSAELGKQLEKPLDDFRNKKLFDFGFSDPNKIEIQQGSATRTFTKSGSDWKLNGKAMDTSAVQGVIDQLRDLSATKFASEGFGAAADSITVVSNDGKRTEKAEFSKTGDGYLARRGSEPGLYQLDAKPVNDILEASNKVKPAAGKK